VLIACILSLRTQDTTTGPAAARLFAVADTPATLLRLPARRIASLIYPVGFYRTKARVILGLCRELLERFGGRVPDDIDALLTLHGVGRKTANLVITMGFGKPGICVDTHVHRISNRLGYIRTREPEASEIALRSRLPRCECRSPPRRGDRCRCTRPPAVDGRAGPESRAALRRCVRARCRRRPCSRGQPLPVTVAWPAVPRRLPARWRRARAQRRCPG